MIKNQKKTSILISYFTLVFHMIMSFVLTPFLIKSLGVSEYGVYQIINSFAANLFILNFGLEQVIARNVIKNKLGNDSVGQENFLALSSLISFIMMIFVLICGYLLSFALDPLFGGNLTGSEMAKAKYMYLYLLANVAAMLWSNLFTGIIIGHENQVLVRILYLLRIVLRVVLIVILILLGKDAVAIVMADLVVSIFLLIVEAVYVFFVLKVKIKFHFYDKKTLYIILTFSLATFLQSITVQVNESIDRVLLGAMTDPATVTLYSISLIIFGTTLNISRIIGTVYLPDATKLVLNNASNASLTNLVIQPGRMQAIIVWMVFFGFLLLGKNFLKLWVGEEFSAAWLPGVILLFPTLVACVGTVANSIVDAKLKKMARSLILLFGTAINLVLSIYLIGKIGYIGAAIGTAGSMLIGNIILMNLYYKFYIKLEVTRMYKEIYRGIVSCALLASVVTVPVVYILPDSFIGFIVKGICFVLIYFGLLYKFGMNQEEKRIARSMTCKFLGSGYSFKKTD